MGEGVLRLLPSDWLPVGVVYKISEKKVHCYHTPTESIRLCPSVRERLCHPLGFCFNLATDARGNRVVGVPESLIPDPGMDNSPLHSETRSTVASRPSAVWVLGDSLSMGYGVDDEMSFPYLLSQRNFLVRNLASDSLGATHTERILLHEWKESISDRSPIGSTSLDRKPLAFVWVFSRSDFQDDTQSQSARYKFFLGKWLHSMNFLRAYLEQRKLARDRNDYREYLAEEFQLPDRTHPTLMAIRRIADFARSQRVVPVVLLAPDWSPITGKPNLESSYFLAMKDYFRESGYSIIDTTEDFRGHGDFYIPLDGHPNERAQEVFARRTVEFFKSENKK